MTQFVDHQIPYLMTNLNLTGTIVPTLLSSLHNIVETVQVGIFDEISDMVATVGHKTPIDLETFVRDHIAMFG
jgi:hypothetical protein